MLQPILHINIDRSVALIDIPTSISAAQGTEECPASDELTSCEPLQEPFAIVNEPRSDSGKESALKNTVDEETHYIYRELIDNALREIRQFVPGDWCLPRRITVRNATSSRPKETWNGRRPDVDIPPPIATVSSTMDRSVDESLDELLRSLCGVNAVTTLSFPTNLMRTSISHRGFLGVSRGGVLPQDQPEPEWEPWDCVFENHKRVPLLLSVKRLGDSSHANVNQFKIPPRSSFVLTDCWQSEILHNAVSGGGVDGTLASTFDFILLDPPWPNASVRRKAAYFTQPTLKGMKKLISGMHIDKLLSPHGLVGIWITNKPAVREFVLGPKGLLACLSLQLEEEWLWLKVTAKGNPISDVNSLWRKPYEVFLLARSTQHQQYQQSACSVAATTAVSKPVVTDGHSRNHVKRRVIVAVPDLHSRKPCLKTLVEPLMPDPSKYTALEVFARHLVSGWWSWGNEVLKWNSEGSWGSGEQRLQSPATRRTYGR